MKKISIGIDFAKEKFDATFLSAVDGRTFHGEYPNTTEGFGQLVAAVKSFAGGVARKGFRMPTHQPGTYTEDLFLRITLTLQLGSKRCVKRSACLPKDKAKILPLLYKGRLASQRGKPSDC